MTSPWSSSAFPSGTSPEDATASTLPRLGGLVPALLPALRPARGPGSLRMPAAPGHGTVPRALHGTGGHGHLVLSGGPGAAAPWAVAAHRQRWPCHRPPRPDPPPGLRAGPQPVEGFRARRQGPAGGPVWPAGPGLPGPRMEPAGAGGGLVAGPAGAGLPL